MKVTDDSRRILHTWVDSKQFAIHANYVPSADWEQEASREKFIFLCLQKTKYLANDFNRLWKIDAYSSKHQRSE